MVVEEVVVVVDVEVGNVGLSVKSVDLSVVEIVTVRGPVVTDVVVATMHSFDGPKRV